MSNLECIIPEPPGRNICQVGVKSAHFLLHNFLAVRSLLA